MHEREMAAIREARGAANSHFAEAKRLLGSDPAGAESEARAAIDLRRGAFGGPRRRRWKNRYTG